MSYHIHISCLLSDFHTGSWKGWWCQMGDHNLSVRFGLSKCHTTEYYWLDQEMSLFISMTTLDLFLRRSQDISSHLCGNQNRYFKPNHDVFLIIAKWFLGQNLTTAYSKYSDQKKIENWTKINVKLQHKETEQELICGLAERYLTNRRNHRRQCHVYSF